MEAFPGLLLGCATLLFLVMRSIPPPENSHDLMTQICKVTLFFMETWLSVQKEAPSFSWQSGLFCFRQSSGCFHNYTLTCAEQASQRSISCQYDQTLSDLFYLKKVTSQINNFSGRLQYEKNRLFSNYSPFLLLLSHLVYRAINKFTLAKNVALELKRQPHGSSTSWSFIFSPFSLLPSGDFMSLQHFLIPCCQSGRMARRWSVGTFLVPSLKDNGSLL